MIFHFLLHYSTAIIPMHKILYVSVPTINACFLHQSMLWLCRMKHQESLAYPSNLSWWHLKNLHALLIKREGGAGLGELRRSRHHVSPGRGHIATAGPGCTCWSSHNGRDGGGQGRGEVWIGGDRGSNTLDHRLLPRSVLQRLRPDHGR